MKICILGLDGAAPEILFQDERLVNLRRLMDIGVYGRLKSVIPATTVPAWMCMSASQDPGSLGMYGERGRIDHSYAWPDLYTSASSDGHAIWDHLAGEGKKSIIVGVPPNYPPRRLNGISVDCFLTPDAAEEDSIWPAAIKSDINALVGDYPFDIKDQPGSQKDWLKEQIFGMSGKQWKVVRWLLQEQEWDYFHFVDIGLNRIHRAFCKDCDPQHVQLEPDNPNRNLIPDYYLWLDEQIGSVLELLDNDTMVLAVSANGAQRFDKDFAINQWLAREGFLVLNEYPSRVTPFAELRVDWSKTKAWSEGEEYARIFINLQGREPKGVIPAAAYDGFREELKSRLESFPEFEGSAVKPLVFKPEDIYRNVRDVAPDLIVDLSGLSWRAVGGVGYHELHETSGLDSAGGGAGGHGVFVLAAPNCPLAGEFEGAHLLDIAPTLLDLAGSAVPESMQGRSLVAGMKKKEPNSGESESQTIVHDRLTGLGYV